MQISCNPSAQNFLKFLPHFFYTSLVEDSIGLDIQNIKYLEILLFALEMSLLSVF